MAAVASAQAQRIELAPSEAVQCMTPAPSQRGGLEYPFAAYKTKQAGQVKLELEFEAADQRPRVKVLETKGPSEFRDMLVDAVVEHVRGWRVPCLTAGRRAGVIKEFVFRFEDRKVFYSDAVDADDGERTARLACLRHLSGETAAPVCPRPDLPNEVGSIDAQVASRRDLLQWLSDIELEMPSKSLDIVYGDDTTITVPCLKIDLKPKEPSS